MGRSGIDRRLARAVLADAVEPDETDDHEGLDEVTTQVVDRLIAAAVEVDRARRTGLGEVVILTFVIPPDEPADTSPHA